DKYRRKITIFHRSGPGAAVSLVEMRSVIGSKRSWRVGVQVGAGDSLGRSMLEGIIAFAQQHTNWQFRWDRRYDFHFGHDGSIDCLISEARDPDHVALLEQLRIPVVVVSGMTAAGRLPLVTTDDREIVRLAVEHFLEIGMRR